MKTINSYLPVFQGFYNTLFEPTTEEDEIHNYNQENDTDCTYDDFRWFNEEYEQRVSKACVEAIEHELKDFGINMEYENLVSPPYYNFVNDSINVEYKLSNENYQLLIDYLEDNFDSFADYIQERYPSRDGFSSFYSNDARVWLSEYKNDDDKLEHIFGTFLGFYLQNEGYDAMELHHAVCHEMYIECEPLKPSNKEIQEYMELHNEDEVGIDNQWTFEDAEYYLLLSDKYN